MRLNGAPKPFPRAIKPLPGKVTDISAEIIAHAMEVSRKSPRRRVIFPFYKSNKDTLHRMLNVIQPGSYTQSHRHINPPKAEAIVVIRGAGASIVFNENGEITDVFFLSIYMNQLYDEINARRIGAGPLLKK